MDEILNHLRKHWGQFGVATLSLEAELKALDMHYGREMLMISISRAGAAKKPGLPFLKSDLPKLRRRQCGSIIHEDEEGAHRDQCQRCREDSINLVKNITQDIFQIIGYKARS